MAAALKFTLQKPSSAEPQIKHSVSEEQGVYGTDFDLLFLTLLYAYILLV